MTCTRCGAENAEGSSFCIKCGASLVNNQNPQVVATEAPKVNEVQQNPVANEMPSATTQVTPQVEVVEQPKETIIPNEAQTVVENTVQTAPVSTATANVTLNYIHYIISMLIKPFKTFKKESTKLESPKNSIVLALIVTVALTLLKIISLIISAIKLASSSKYFTIGDFFKETSWIKIIGQNFLIYAGIILAIAAVYYVVGLIAKKTVNFPKILAISATALLPYAIGSMILAPIGGYIWVYLSTLFSAAGAIYSFIILYELLNEELKIEGDTKIYINVACLLILIIGAALVMTMLLKSSISSSISSLGSIYDLLY